MAMTKEEYKRHQIIDFINLIVSIIPDEYKSEKFNKETTKIINSSCYTAPESLVNIKIKFCNLLSYMIPYKDDQPWCSEIRNLINNIRFDN
jgi:hypothetical protein